ncbi:MAG: hypothetical protein WC865_12610 [Bacteroidales bacterium]
MNKRIWVMLLAIVAFLPGCKKYEDGPLMSLYSKGMRVAGTWYFQSVLYGAKDSTELYRYQRMDFIYVKKIDGGAFTWNHNLLATSADDNPLEGGKWRFFSDRDSFEMIVYKNQFRDSVVMRWKIDRLAYTEFWLERNVKDTINLQWQLVKYAF